MRENLKQFIALRPGGCKGAITNADLYYLYNLVLNNRPNRVVELGIAGGIASATILKAFEDAHLHSELHSYDILEYCYFNEDLKVGFAVERMIKNEETLNNYKKYVNECSLSLKKYVEKESVDFLFIDANHRHPWPCVDILFAIEYLSNDSVICLHDINLPSVNKNFQSFGVKYIFDELMEIFHYTVSIDDIPNIGAINISGKHQKQELKQIAKNCISLYKWETDIVNDEVKNALNVLLEE